MLELSYVVSLSVARHAVVVDFNRRANLPHMLICDSVYYYYALSPVGINTFSPSKATGGLIVDTHPHLVCQIDCWV